MEKFFPSTARADMEQQFINPKQKGMLVNEYAAEFTHLSHFASYMVAKDGDRARRFEQGLNGEIKRNLASHHLDTYAKVLDAARHQERTILSTRPQQTGAQKRPMTQEVGPSKRGGIPPRRLPPPQVQPRHMICNFCQKPGHLMKD